MPIQFAFFILILIYLGVPILVTLAEVVAFFAWGGVRRNAPALLALGLWNLVIGTIFLAVHYASARAVMDNAYLLNITLGPFCVLVGVIFLFGSLVAFGVPWWLAAPLIVVGIGGEYYAYKKTAESITISTVRPLPQGFTPYGGQLLIPCAAAILVVTVALALLWGRWRSLAQSLLVGTLGALAILVPYLYGHSDASYWQWVDDLEKPQYTAPYVGFKELILYPLVGVAIFLIARRLDRGVAPAGERQAQLT
ncbi:MAG TPA: hypothetical protein VH393_05655 [Ktedonobacterales bacterium]|jgi:hypothetical protein